MATQKRPQRPRAQQQQHAAPTQGRRTAHTPRQANTANKVNAARDGDTSLESQIINWLARVELYALPKGGVVASPIPSPLRTVKGRRHGA